jgi:phosphoribosylformylglycinamidine synthase
VASSPEYDRPWIATPASPVVAAAEVPACADVMAALRRLMASPDLASKRWIWEQYDHMVMADTVQRPGGSAGVVRVHGTRKGLAMSCDCTPRYCFADPVQGGRQAVAEAWRNLTAVGASPLAITDCLNFGNPEKPEIMGQFAGCIGGMAEACEALEFPVVSGNVSFYNETNGVAIPPTPAIGGVGLIGDVNHMATIALKADGDVLLLVGGPVGDPGDGQGGWLGQSLYLREIHGREEGAPPPVDLDIERRTGDFVRDLITEGLVSTCHDVSDGGLLVAVCEMALAGDMGVTLEAPEASVPANGWFFGEDQARYVLSVPRSRAEALRSRAAAANVPLRRIGVAGGQRLTVEPSHSISLSELRALHEDWLPRYMSGRARGGEGQG